MRGRFRPLGGAGGAGTGIAKLMVGSETAVVEEVVAFIARTAAGTAVGATVGGIRGATIGATAGPTVFDVTAGSNIRGGIGKRGRSRGGCTVRGPFPW